MKTALILSGGGARAAYQVGVLKAVAELMPQSDRIPFQIICGTSSGAINAAKLAAEADHFHGAVNRLESLWSNLQSHKVHRVGNGELIRSVLTLFGSFFHSGIARGRPLSLFDNGPLKELLRREVDVKRWQTMIDQNCLHALCITALGYSSGENISFFQGASSLTGWKSARRIGVRTELSIDHLLASSALPAIFPAVRINREYFGDGALRQTAPMSAALHLGADKLFVVGVSGNSRIGAVREKVSHSPSLAQVLAQLLNSAFIDSLEEDLEMMLRFNRFVTTMDEEQRRELKVRPVEALIIQPSVAFDRLAGQHTRYLPQSMKTLLKIIGANPKGGGSSLASYVLFEREYCSELMKHGYQDAMEQAEDIRRFVAS